MAKGKGKADTSDRGSLPLKSGPQSALITNPKNRPVLVAKVRDDLNALRMAGFWVEYTKKPQIINGQMVLAVNIQVVAPPGDALGVSGKSITYNGKVLE